MDASAAVAALRGPGPAREALRDDRVVVPHLIDAEVLNALRRAVRVGDVSPGDGTAAIRVWAALGVLRVSTVGLIQRIWQLRENVSAYDATYVALAETLECPLMSADAGIAGAPGIRCEVVVVPR